MTRATVTLIFNCLLLCAFVSVQAKLGIIDSIHRLGKDLKDNTITILSDSTHFVKRIAFNVESFKCNVVKRVFGLNYENLKGSEPNLNELLTLEQRYNNVRTIHNISTAGYSITKMPDYNKDQKLIIFIHGFHEDPLDETFTNINDALTTYRGERNVLALNCRALIRSGWFYKRSTVYARFAGEKLAETLADLVEVGRNPSSIHIIGHTIGAHIAGFTGKSFYNLTGFLLGRITGLDPILPCFSTADSDLRLNKEDAEFVDVIHTDAGVFGMSEPMGHADFYPNGGTQQLGCSAELQSEMCSHMRAWLYFAESIRNPDAFIAHRCKDWEEFKKHHCEEVEGSFSKMGYSCNAKASGNYYLQTAKQPPFGKNLEGLNYHNEDSYIKNIFDNIG